MAKTKAHVRYKLADKKTIVPGVTTVLGLRAKPQLVPWANKLGLEGIDVKSYVDDKADIGTLGHAMSTDYLTGAATDFTDYDPKQIAKAENCFLSFLTWTNEHPIHTIFVERPLVHEDLKFGGTLDIYAEMDGKKMIIDLKTGKGVYPEHKHQVSALKHLLEFNGYPVDGCRILNIPRSEDEKFIDEPCSEKELAVGWEIFKNLLSVYYLEKQLKGE